MKFEDVVKERYSCRNFSDKPVAHDLLEAIMNDGRLSPSASNSQRWSFVGIDDPAKVKEISDAIYDEELKINVFAPDVPAYIAIISTPKRELNDRQKKVLGEDGKNWLDIDLGIAAATIAMSATDKGLGNIIVGHFKDPDAAEKVLELTPGRELALIIAVGYENAPPERRVRRKEAEEVIYWNTYKGD